MKEFKGNLVDVRDYEGLYKVSDLGAIYSLRKWRGKHFRKLKYHLNAFGYPVFSLTKNGNTKGITAHKIVTTSFLGERPLGMEVRHLDGNKLNFQLNNLKYGTAKENAADRDKHNTTARGENIGSAKLSNDDVMNIRKLYRKRGDMVKLADKYNVSCANIYMIITKQSRKHG